MSEIQSLIDDLEHDEDHNVQFLISARAELLLLRAAAAERERLQAVVDAQAAQLEQARDLLLELKWAALDMRVDSWLAANAPAPEADEATK